MTDEEYKWIREWKDEKQGKRSRVLTYNNAAQGCLFLLVLCLGIGSAFTNETLGVGVALTFFLLAGMNLYFTRRRKNE